MPQADATRRARIGHELIQSDKVSRRKGQQHVTRPPHIFLRVDREIASFSRGVETLSAREKLEMAQTMASMTGLSQGVRLPGPAGRRASRFTVRASSAEAEAAGRRAVLGLMASGVVGSAFAQVVHAGTVAAIKVGPPPPLSGGLRECLHLLVHHLLYSL